MQSTSSTRPRLRQQVHTANKFTQHTNTLPIRVPSTPRVLSPMERTCQLASCKACKEYAHSL